jgi:hypothetical protein
VSLARSAGARQAHRVAAAGWVLLSAGLAVSAWRWYAVLASTPGLPRDAWTLLAAGCWVAGGLVVWRATASRAARITIAAGMVAAAAWLAPLAAGSAEEVGLESGASATVPGGPGGPLAVTHLSVSRFEVPGGMVSAGTVEVSRDGEPARTMVTERRVQMNVMGAPLGAAVRPSLVPGLLADARLELAGAAARAGDATYRVRIAGPAWLGVLAALLVLTGGVMAALHAGQRAGS